MRQADGEWPSAVEEFGPTCSGSSVGGVQHRLITLLNQLPANLVIRMEQPFTQQVPHASARLNKTGQTAHPRAG